VGLHHHRRSGFVAAFWQWGFDTPEVKGVPGELAYIRRAGRQASQAADHWTALLRWRIWRS
jgi:hypothetical protein